MALDYILLEAENLGVAVQHTNLHYTISQYRVLPIYPVNPSDYTLLYISYYICVYVRALLNTHRHTHTRARACNFVGY